MSAIRPEAREFLIRWSEVFAALVVLCVGLWWAARSYGAMAFLGYALVPIGAAWAFIGWRRARFHSTGHGPGVVRVDEGELRYFGPLSGGSVQVVDLQRVILDPSLKPAHWILEHDGGPALQIPVNAEGADALFDVFSSLKDIKTERMLGQLQGGATYPVVIWQRRDIATRITRLH